MKQDDQLLSELLAQDVDQHFHLVVEQYEARLQYTVYKWTRNVQDAEDIAQETFLRAYRAFLRYPPQMLTGLHIWSWLCKAAIRVCLNKKREQPDEIGLEEIDHEVLEALEDLSQKLPEHLFELSERRQWLLAALAAMPNFSEELLLFYFEELTHQEIGQRLGKPIGTVKSNLSRGRAKLRQSLEVRKKEIE